MIALSAIVENQAAPTLETMGKVKLFLGYVTTHPGAVLTFKKINMILAVHSNVSYLTEPAARR